MQNRFAMTILIAARRYMYFEKTSPSPPLARFVECYWKITDNGTEVRCQKIVPDGFPEVMIHLGDPYRINIANDWKRQSQFLLAGQIRKFFHLENTGRSSVFGIKFKPAAITLLFGIDMSSYTDQVVDLTAFSNFEPWCSTVINSHDFQVNVATTESFLLGHLSTIPINLHPVETALQYVFEKFGLCTVDELANRVGVGARQLELYFKKYVGLSPKFYARVVRFSRIFQLVQDERPRWVDIAHLAGYFDQAHFIKNFKAFTGEEPARYGFDRQDLANFFMKKV